MQLPFNIFGGLGLTVSFLGHTGSSQWGLGLTLTSKLFTGGTEKCASISKYVPIPQRILTMDIYSCYVTYSEETLKCSSIKRVSYEPRGMLVILNYQACKL